MTWNPDKFVQIWISWTIWNPDKFLSGIQMNPVFKFLVFRWLLYCTIWRSDLDLYFLWNHNNWRAIIHTSVLFSIFIAIVSWRNLKHHLKLTFLLPTALWTLFRNISGFECSEKLVSISGVWARTGPLLSFDPEEVDTWGACPEFERVRSPFGIARRWP